MTTDRALARIMELHKLPPADDALRLELIQILSRVYTRGHADGYAEGRAEGRNE